MSVRVNKYVLKGLEQFVEIPPIKLNKYSIKYIEKKKSWLKTYK